VPLLGFNRVSSEEEMVSSRRKALDCGVAATVPLCSQTRRPLTQWSACALVLNERPKMARGDRGRYDTSVVQFRTWRPSHICETVLTMGRF
jgi:hypothetical protein